MESVVATFVAGHRGGHRCGRHRAQLRSLTKHVIKGVTDVPPFPYLGGRSSDCFVSLGCRCILAGVLPALIAVRVKIIDADPVLRPR